MRYLFVVLLFLSGCITKAEHEDTLNSWLGSTEQEIVSSWGPPNGFYESVDVRYLTWSNNSQSMVGGYGSYSYTDLYGNVYTSPGVPPTIVNNSCDITMKVMNEVIVSWSYEGNNCYDI